jgi:hypothetical protein
MRPRDLPELGVVKTATPCSVEWDDMQGDEVKRFCGKCRRYVWDFSRLTSTEARALIVETEGRLCGRIFTRTDGTVLTKDCPSGVARKRVRSAAAAAALLSVSAIATGALLAPASSCGDSGALVDAVETTHAIDTRIQEAARLLQSANSPGTKIVGKLRIEPKQKPKR